MMHDIYHIILGPMVWAAFILFIGGSLYRLVAMWRLSERKDPGVLVYMNFYYAMRSILHWIIPFSNRSMQKHPVITAVAFVFHICVIVTPLFLFAHIILVKESWDISWWFMPDKIADAMTLIVILSCVFFLFRRLIRPEVRYLTTASDYFLLAFVAVPFVSGFWAYHQWPGYNLAMIFHILSGELLLAVIPFSRLGHMLFFPFTRGYMGSEFGAVKRAKDW